MCGLVGLLSKKNKPVGQQVFNLYSQQKRRGSEGFGYIGINFQREITGIHRAKTEAEIRSKLMSDKSEIILFHHRFPTSTKNTLGTTHPIFVSNEELDHDYYFAHNGVISNAGVLKNRHEQAGYSYLTEFKEVTYAQYSNNKSEKLLETISKFNDSESLAIELARYCDGQTNKVDTVGAVAFWGIQVSKTDGTVTKIYYGKNRGRDLGITRNKKYWGFASEKGADVAPLKLFTLDLIIGEDIETDLPIDDFEKPVITTPTVGYGANSNTYARDTKKSLVNKEYTREEALETGHALTEFFTEDRPYGRVFIPNVWASFSNSRAKLIQERLPMLPTPASIAQRAIDMAQKERREKDQDKMEELCEKMAKLENQREKIEEFLNSGQAYSSKYFKRRLEKIEQELEEIHSNFATLPFSEDEVDEYLDLARQLASYDSYNELLEEQPIINYSE